MKGAVKLQGGFKIKEAVVIPLEGFKGMERMNALPALIEEVKSMRRPLPALTSSSKVSHPYLQLDQPTHQRVGLLQPYKMYQRFTKVCINFHAITFQKIS